MLKLAVAYRLMVGWEAVMCSRRAAPPRNLRRAPPSRSPGNVARGGARSTLGRRTNSGTRPRRTCGGSSGSRPPSGSWPTRGDTLGLACTTSGTPAGRAVAGSQGRSSGRVITPAAAPDDYPESGENDSFDLFEEGGKRPSRSNPSVGPSGCRRPARGGRTARSGRRPTRGASGRGIPEQGRVLRGNHRRARHGFHCPGAAPTGGRRRSRPARASARRLPHRPRTTRGPYCS
jgi:hypothetical protein